LLQFASCTKVLRWGLQDHGKYEEAEAIETSARGKERALGSEHPVTLKSINNLASLLQYQGEYETAEAMNRRGLEWREKALGLEHSDALASVSNLALALQDQSRGG
jgi:hypothetical protein